MSHTETGPPRQQRARRSHQLRERGMTWEQIADVWEIDYPGISPRTAFRWAHNLSHQDVAERWNLLDPGEPTMTKSRIYEFEAWPKKGRRPSVNALRMLARIYQTTARRLLTADEYSRYDASSQGEIDEVDHRSLDVNQRIEESASRMTLYASPLATSATQKRPEQSIAEGATVPFAFSIGVGTGSDLATMDAFRAADKKVGGGHLYPSVIGYLQTAIAPRMFGGLSTSKDKQIFVSASALSEMAGWMAHDAGHDVAAWQHFRRSLDLA